MSYSGYYKRLPDGRYLCPVCGTIHAFSSQKARQCCSDSKPYSLIQKQAEDILITSYPPLKLRYTHRNLVDNTRSSTPMGHYYRGHETKKKLTTTITKAQRKALRDERHAFNYWLNQQIPEVDPSTLFKPRKASHWQLISYAYYNHNWHMLKSEVESLIEDRIQARLLYQKKHPEDYFVD